MSHPRRDWCAREGTTFPPPWYSLAYELPADLEIWKKHPGDHICLLMSNLLSLLVAGLFVAIKSDIFFDMIWFAIGIVKWIIRSVGTSSNTC